MNNRLLDKTNDESASYIREVDMLAKRINKLPDIAKELLFHLIKNMPSGITDNKTNNSS